MACARVCDSEKVVRCQKLRCDFRFVLWQRLQFMYYYTTTAIVASNHLIFQF